MEFDLIREHQKKVSKILSNTLWVVMLILIVYAAVVAPPIDNLIKAAIVLSFNIAFKLCMKFEKDRIYSKYIVSICFMVLCITYDNSLIMCIFCILGSFMVACMYFETKLFAKIAVLGNVFMIINIIMSGMDTFTVSMLLVCTNVMAMAIYFVTKWSSDLVLRAIKEVTSNHNLVEKLEETFVTIDDNTDALNKNILENTSNIVSITSESNRLSSIVTDVATGTKHQSTTISNIENMIKEIDDTIEKAYVVSSSTTTSSENAKTVINEGSGSVTQLNESVGYMRSVIDSAILSINTLVSQIQDVTNSLSNIKNISSQTNLLALNASIEAARVGEAGKGFGIVANEVKALANDSSTVVTEIDKILVLIGETIETVLSGMMEVKKASSQGEENTSSVTKVFSEINSTFKLIDDNIKENLSAINNIKNIYSDTVEGIGQISAIAISNSELAQESLAITQNQTTSLQEIKNATEHIQELSESLKQVIDINKN